MVQRFLCAALCTALLFGASASAASRLADGSYQDFGEGFRGRIVATVTIRDGSIQTVTAESRGDTPDEYLQTALDSLAPAIVKNNGIDGVDAVSGATGSSNGILEAMRGVLAQAAVGYVSGSANDGAPSTSATAAPKATVDPATAETTLGLGSACNFRVGPGKDDTDTQVYSFNVTMATAVFDRQGRILDVEVDVYEIATPNYDGETMPHFSGWPNTEGYNTFDHQQGKVSGKSTNTEESAAAELEAWQTKRQRGSSYGMNPTNDWYQQMDAYEQWMIGKTVEEIRNWYARYTSVRNGRPIKESSDNADDQKALSAMTEDERKQLADVVSMATMSLSDSHGLILEAVESAYANRKAVSLP